MKTTWFVGLAALTAQTLCAQSEAVSEVLSLRDSLETIPFTVVVEAATGARVLPVDPENDAGELSALGEAFDSVLATLNEPDHPVRSVGRINEASRFIEDGIRESINLIPGWECAIPRTAQDQAQRSGYPDLRVVTPTGKVFFLDAKLFDRKSRESTLRTFYYEPRGLAGKIHEDAVHLLVGVEHDGKPSMRLTGWSLVDLARVDLKLKAEFQTDNRNLYGSSTVVARSED